MLYFNKLARQGGVVHHSSGEASHPGKESRTLSRCDLRVWEAGEGKEEEEPFCQCLTQMSAYVFVE